jgi:hypothetical protein
VQLLNRRSCRSVGSIFLFGGDWRQRLEDGRRSNLQIGGNLGAGESP